MCKLHKLFPAHAGVIPPPTVFAVRRATFPRPRGGDPIMFIKADYGNIFSPPTRG